MLQRQYFHLTSEFRNHLGFLAHQNSELVVYFTIKVFYIRPVNSDEVSGDELDAELPEPLGQVHVLGLLTGLVKIAVAQVLSRDALHLWVQCGIACGRRTLFKTNRRPTH